MSLRLCRTAGQGVWWCAHSLRLGPTADALFNTLSEALDSPVRMCICPTPVQHSAAMGAALSAPLDATAGTDQAAWEELHRGAVGPSYVPRTASWLEANTRVGAVGDPPALAPWPLVCGRGACDVNLNGN